MRRVIISGNECYVSEDGRLVEYLVSCDEGQQGCVVIGKVGRIMPGLSAAFIDIGRKNAGFLPLAENIISKQVQLKSGDLVPVQIRREEHGGKGAFLSRDLSFTGKYLILMPMNRSIAVSSRIKDEKTRERLRVTGKKISSERFGLVMRTCAADMSEEILEEEAEELYEKWMHTQSVISSAKKADIVFRMPSEIETAVSEWASRGVDEYVIENESIACILPDDAAYTIKQTEVCIAPLKTQLNMAKDKTVRMRHGGNIVIDECEALTVIDVNTASDAGDGDSFFRTDLEACSEIAIQVRLRNISGIIILDMIDLDTDEQREQVLEKLRECFDKDRIKTVIHGFTSLGLVEMTRKRTGLSLLEKFSLR